MITDEQNLGITNDPVVWANHVAHRTQITQTPPYGFIPDGAINYFSKYFDALMMSPVVFFQGMELSAKTQDVKNTKEFLENLKNTQSLVFLYMPLWIPWQPIFRKYDEQMVVKELDEPEYTGGFWKIRYAIAEKNITIGEKNG